MLRKTLLRSALFSLVVTVFLGASAALVPAMLAFAQSPTPSWDMLDERPGNGYPTGYNAVVVEGLGILNGCAYSESSVEQATVNFINSGLQTVTEVSPQSGCGTISQYETLIQQIVSYVEAHSSNPGRYWAGIMLDEEPGFGFSVSQLEALNSYVANEMASTPGMSWWFAEDQPNGWYLSDYNALLGNSWPAPQVYSSSMATAVNDECSTYGNCTDLVTIDSQLAYPWNDPSYVTGLVNGTPWENGYWGNGYWYNVWQPQ